MTIKKPDGLTGDLWGGLAAMFVTLPSAIAFGVTIFAPLGGTYAAYGALAGILGTTAVGIVAASFGGTNRLISAPCAPAAAVLAAFAIELSQQGISAESAVLSLTLTALVCGILQLLFGTIGLGRLIKYMPYPVVSGYLSGVGLTIIVSQIPKFLGAPKGINFWDALGSPSMWHCQGIFVGAVTMAVMVAAPAVIKAVPAAILGLASGIIAYMGLCFAYPSLCLLEGNTLVIGPLAGSGASLSDTIFGHWKAFGGMNITAIGNLLVPAVTLAVLLSIDTLKTCIVLDTLTRSRHNSNKELIGQGLGNLTSSLIGGMPGAGTMGATLVNISSGARTRLSGIIEGSLALVVFLILGKLIAWVPIAALSGILIVIGFRMLDRHSLLLLKSRSTILDFFVIVAVVIVALTVSLIAASGAGIALAIGLFIREQIHGSIVRSKTYGNQNFSKQIRLPEEMAILEKHGDRSVVFELQGSLFFGTTDQLYTALEPELKTRSYIILDMRRVQSVDVTAAHMLQQVEDMLAENKAFLILSQLPENVSGGHDLRQYFDQLGQARQESCAKTFDELDNAMEWVENRIIEEARLERIQEKPLELREIDLFKNRKEKALAALESCMEMRSHKAGEKIFSIGETGDEIFLIRSGTVRIVLPLGGKQSHHLATFGRGDFFGEMAFLDKAPRSADAMAFTDTDLFVLSRSRFDTLADEHKKIAINLIEGIARVLAIRLRYANTELRTLHMT